MIVRGELEAGERLLEDKLAEQLGVSRNPVREAIRSLEATGLVQVIPRRGAYVCRPELDDIRHLLQVRAVLEAFAVEAAIEADADWLVDALDGCIEEGRAASDRGNSVRASELHQDFHDAIERAAGNPYLQQVVEPLRQRTEMVFSILLETRGAMSWNEHQRVRDAIAAGDVDGARTSIVDHLMSVLDNLEQRATDDSR